MITSVLTAVELSPGNVRPDDLLELSVLVYFTVILDRDETKNMGVENGTYKSGDLTRHYEKLDLYNSGLQYIVRE